MTTHTTGPWHRNIKPATKYTTVWSGRNKHVAYVAVNGLAAEEVEANIALIAAAPAMLAALRVACNHIDPMDCPDADWQQIQNAIAAAGL